MAIGTCAWMEREWLRTIPDDMKEKFAMGRFMDDICMLIDTNSSYDWEAFKRDFRASLCYMPPLKLEDAAQDTFLETFLDVQRSNVEWRLKNKNEGAHNSVPVTVFFNHQHYDSYGPVHMKRGAVIGVLKKMKKLCSSEAQQQRSLEAKKQELANLNYPRTLLVHLANTLLQRERN